LTCFYLRNNNDNNWLFQQMYNDEHYSESGVIMNVSGVWAFLNHWWSASEYSRRSSISPLRSSVRRQTLSLLLSVLALQDQQHLSLSSHQI